MSRKNTPLPTNMNIHRYQYYHHHHYWRNVPSQLQRWCATTWPRYPTRTLPRSQFQQRLDRRPVCHSYSSYGILPLTAAYHNFRYVCSSRRKFSTPSFNNHIRRVDPTWVPFLLADIGEGIKEVEVIQWFVQPGQHVQQFDAICQVQSDKATVDITSRYDGTIAALGGRSNSSSPDDNNSSDPPIIQVGQPLLYFYPANTNDTNGNTVTNFIDSTGSGNGIGTSGSLETTVAPPAELPKQDDRTEIFNQTHDEVDDDRSPTNHNINDTSNGNNNHSIAQASPAVRRIAREYGISNAVFNTMIQGTGPNQRILKSDVLSYVNHNTENHSSNRHVNSLSQDSDESDRSKKFTTTSTTVTKESAVVNADTKDKIISLRGYTRHMISTMTTSLQIPHMCFGDEIIMNNLMTLRQQINNSLLQPGNNDVGDDTIPPKALKVSLLALLIKAVSCAMIDYPIINSIQMMEQNRSVSEGMILQKQNHNFGIAIDTMSRGLVVPVLHECQNKSVLTIQTDIDQLKQLALSNQLQKEHFTDMTFTISNIGSIGSGMFLQPVIVPPTLAMGAFGCTKMVPRFRSSEEEHVTKTTSGRREIYEAQVMNVTWAGDHRFLDGATMGRFHNRFRYYVEEHPMMLLLK